jgi:hypothetical protein
VLHVQKDVGPVSLIGKPVGFAWVGLGFGFLFLLWSFFLFLFFSAFWFRLVFVCAFKSWIVLVVLVTDGLCASLCASGDKTSARRTGRMIFLFCFHAWLTVIDRFSPFSPVILLKYGYRVSSHIVKRNHS